MECTSSSYNEPLPTTFEETVLITPAELSNYWHSFPQSVKKAINKTKNGELPPITNEELTAKLERYLHKKRSST